MAAYADVMLTAAVRQALDKYRFDIALGGGRRDEEKSRAKERIFSLRSAQHRWDPKAQRPELWRNYNAASAKAKCMRAFPLSNWTELDIWQYIHLEQIPIVPLYYAKPRPVVERNGMLIVVDDDRMPLADGRDTGHGSRCASARSAAIRSPVRHAARRTRCRRSSRKCC